MVNLGGKHRQTPTAVDFHKRKTLGRSSDSQLADLTEEEHPCICGREREREKTLLCHSWGFSCTKTSQAEDLGHSCSIPANAAQVGSSREQKDRISLGKGQAVKAGLDSFSPLPARATRPTQETTSVSKIPADGEEKKKTLESMKPNIWLIGTPQWGLLGAIKSKTRLCCQLGGHLLAKGSAQCQGGPHPVPRVAISAGQGWPRWA